MIITNDRRAILKMEAEREGIIAIKYPDGRIIKPEDWDERLIMGMEFIFEEGQQQ